MVGFKGYKYIGMPFHAVGFPQPVYSHLMGSNDGVNWDDLKSYNFGWRDTDIAYINGEFWTCTGTYVNHTTDFENFTQINCPDMGLKNLWASEFFKDAQGQWWFIYCGSVGDVDYSEYKLYASKMYPEKYQIDSNRQDITLNVSGGYIDPNMNYINGYYYLWTSKTSSPTQELHLFKSQNVLGPYDEVPQNAMAETNSAGFTWNEAPEMLQVDGKYYLYSDPWNKGESESDRDVYRMESTDLVTWSNPQKCNADCTMRHFTPLDIQGLVKDNPTPPINVPDSSTGGDDSSSSTIQPPIPQSSKIELWDGNVGTLNSTNQNNFSQFQALIDRINRMAQNSSIFSEINVKFDVQLLPLSNRNARIQFLKNAVLLNQLLPDLVDMYRYDDYAFEYEEPIIPRVLYFDKPMWNGYWQAVIDDFNFIKDQTTKIAQNYNVSDDVNTDNSGNSTTPSYDGKWSASIVEFYNDKSNYYGGENAIINFTIKSLSDEKQTARYQLEAQTPFGDPVVIADSSVTLEPLTTTEFSTSWNLPNDNIGYLLTLRVYDNNNVLMSLSTNGLDVVDSWTQHPRYGALTNFTQSTQTSKDSIEQDIDTLNKFHINATMYYDAYFRPQNPLPGNTFNTWIGDEINTDLIRKGIDCNHSRGQNAMLYDMINATTGTPSDNDTNMTNHTLFGDTITRQDGTKGIASKMGVYRTSKVITGQAAGTFDGKGEQATFNMLGDFNDRNDVDHKVQYYYNPASRDWQAYIGEILINAIDDYGFDGWQGDTIGNINGAIYENRDTGQTFNTSGTYDQFVNYQKQRWFASKCFGMNTVNYDGQDAINKSSADFNYSEIWQDSYSKYIDLANLIEKVNNTSSHPLIMPAYLYQKWYKSGGVPSHFLDDAVLLRDAVIFAHGGAPMELADNGYQLPTEYYPDTRKNYKIMMTNALGDPDNGKLRKMYNFVCAYSNLLYGLKMINNQVAVFNEMQYDISSSNADTNKVYAFAKSNGDVETINLINMMGVSDSDWQINNANDENSKRIVMQSNLTIKYYTDKRGKLYHASFDNSGIRQELKYNENSDSNGRYITFTIPTLETWDLIYMN